MSRKSVTEFDHPHYKENFPNVQSEPHLAQLCAVFAHLAISYKGEETSTSLSVSPPQEAIESNEAPLSLFFCPPLDTFKTLDIFFFFFYILWRLELHTIFKTRPPTPILHSMRITSFDQLGILCLM